MSVTQQKMMICPEMLEKGIWSKGERSQAYVILNYQSQSNSVTLMQARLKRQF